MSLDQELTPGGLKGLKSEQIVIASSFDDLMEKSKGMPDSGVIVGTGGELEYLLKTWKGKPNSWSELKGKRVLDIASGSASNRDYIQTWYPHFARLCAVNGAYVTAIDSHPQVGSDLKLLHGISANLIPIVMDKRLAEVVGSEEKYDIIHSSSFVGVNPPSNFEDSLKRLGIDMKVFEQSLFEQSFSLLSEGGIITLGMRDKNREPIYYTKKDGKPVQL